MVQVLNLNQVSIFGLMKQTLFLIFLLKSLTIMGQNSMEMPLYDGAVPNSKPSTLVEKVETRADKSRFISGTSTPTLTAYIPEKGNGMAIVVCPGGGYRGVSIDKEGHNVAKALNEKGIAAFVLKYRTPNDTFCIDKSLAPLQDAQQALRTVRKNAVKWHINTSKVGIMGFSAGGHLASTASTHFTKNADSAVMDTTNVRPDFAILLYPVISFSEELMHKGSRDNLIGKTPSAEMTKLYSNELQITPQSPPTFIVHAADDKTVKVENSVQYYLSCIKNGVLTEMHLYPKGGHGFGLNNTTTEDKWIERLFNWLKTL